MGGSSINKGKIVKKWVLPFRRLLGSCMRARGARGDRTWKPSSRQVTEAEQSQEMGQAYGLKAGDENKDSRVSNFGPHLPKLETQGTGLVLSGLKVLGLPGTGIIKPLHTQV